VREILFRGKRIDNGKLVFGSLIIREEESPVPETTETYKQYFILVGGFNAVEYEVIPETVSEFTGLLDKNGTKIFEGDIVSYWNGTLSRDKNGDIEIYNKRYSRTAEKISVVVFKESAFRLKDHNPINCFVREQALKVIGNIHDNPELLGETNVV